MRRKEIARLIGISLMGFGAFLGLVGAGWVLYGPGFPAGTVLPVVASPVVFWGFWCGAAFLIAGVAVTLVEELAMKEETLEKRVEAGPIKLNEPIPA